MKKNILSEVDLLIVSLILKAGGCFKLKTFINEELFLERDMLCSVSDVSIKEHFLVLSLDVGMFFEHNSLLMTECYPPNNTTKAKGLFKILYTATESGNYSDKVEIFFDISDYSCPDEVMSCIDEYITPHRA